MRMFWWYYAKRTLPHGIVYVAGILTMDYIFKHYLEIALFQSSFPLLFWIAFAFYGPRQMSYPRLEYWLDAHEAVDISRILFDAFGLEVARSYGDMTILEGKTEWRFLRFPFFALIRPGRTVTRVTVPVNLEKAMDFVVKDMLYSGREVPDRRWMLRKAKQV